MHERDTETPCRTIDMFFASGMTQQYNNRAGKHLYSFAERSYRQNPCSSNFDRGSSNERMLSCIIFIFILRAVHGDVIRTESQRGISLDKESSYTDTSSLSSSPYSSLIPLLLQITGRKPISINSFNMSYCLSWIKKFKQHRMHWVHNPCGAFQCFHRPNQ